MNTDEMVRMLVRALETRDYVNVWPDNIDDGNPDTATMTVVVNDSSGHRMQKFLLTVEALS